jgi:hypothetical protein
MSIEQKFAQRINFDDCLKVFAEAMAHKIPLVVEKKSLLFLVYGSAGLQVVL